jgi:SAM-dependent methyltransferase
MKAQTIKDRLSRIIMPPSPNLNVSRKIEELLKMLGDRATVLDLGSGTRRRSAHVINIDCQPHPEVDIMADAHKLPFKEGVFDAIIADAVLEHVKEPLRVVEEIRAALKKGGYIYAEIPFLQPFHAAPTDYQRYTLEGIKNLFAGFESIETGVCVGPTSAVCGLVMNYIPFAIDIPVIRTMLYVFFGWIFFLARYMDLFLARKKNAHTLASSLYFFGKKP